MPTSPLTDRVTTLVAQWAPEPVPVATSELRLVEDLGYDSLSLIELATSLAHEFSVAVPDQDLVEVRSVGDVVDLLEGLVA